MYCTMHDQIGGCNMANELIYWNKILISENALKKHKNAIEKMFHGDYKVVLDKILEGEYQAAGLDLKRAKDRIYGVEINYTDRLLFKSIMVNGEECLLFIEEVNNHKYNKAKSLKKTSKTSTAHIHIDLTIERTEDKPTQDEIFNFPAILTAPKNIVFEQYGCQSLFLDGSQQEVLTRAMPLLISGPAGSGKSCMAFSLLKQMKKAVYVTQSQNLVNEMKERWLAAGNDLSAIKILTYNDLIKDMLPKDVSLIDNDHTLQWIKENSNLKVSASFNRQMLPQKILQEFRILSGCHVKNEYIVLGTKQSLFTLAEDKNIIWNLYQNYLKYCNQEKKINPAFYYFNIKKKYPHIVVDEAQDFSHLQLQQLKKLAAQERIVYCIDTNQSLKDDLSKRPFLKSLVKNNICDLSNSYRCPKNIFDFAKKVIEIKRNVTHGIADKDEMVAVSTAVENKDEGRIIWIDPKNIPHQTKTEFEHLAQTPKFAVVTTAANVEAAKKLFNTALVFTPDQIKGLQYPHIMLYNILNHPMFEQANKKVPDELKAITHRAKNMEAEHEYGPVFNGLYTAITRAQNTLYIYQEPKDHKLNNILSHLQSALPQVAPVVSELKEEKKPEPIDEESLLSQWKREANKQKNEGNIEIAKDIENRYLSKKDSSSTLATAPKRVTANKQVEKKTQPAKINSKKNNNSILRKAIDEIECVFGIPKAKKAIEKLTHIFDEITPDNFFNPLDKSDDDSLYRILLFKEKAGGIECCYKLFMHNPEIVKAFPLKELKKTIDYLYVSETGHKCLNMIADTKPEIFTKQNFLDFFIIELEISAHHQLHGRRHDNLMVNGMRAEDYEREKAIKYMKQLSQTTAGREYLLKILLRLSVNGELSFIELLTMPHIDKTFGKFLVENDLTQEFFGKIAANKQDLKNYLIRAYKDMLQHSADGIKFEDLHNVLIQMVVDVGEIPFDEILLSKDVLFYAIQKKMTASLMNPEIIGEVVQNTFLHKHLTEIRQILIKAEQLSLKEQAAIIGELTTNYEKHKDSPYPFELSETYNKLMSSNVSESKSEQASQKVSSVSHFKPAAQIVSPAKPSENGVLNGGFANETSTYER